VVLEDCALLTVSLSISLAATKGSRMTLTPRETLIETRHVTPYYTLAKLSVSLHSYHSVAHMIPMYQVLFLLQQQHMLLLL
jgi:hypothetical protein